MENWKEATKKLQEASLTVEETREGTLLKEVLNLFNSWGNLIFNSSKAFADEIIRVQEAWKNTYEKQVETGKELTKNFFYPIAT